MFYSQFKYRLISLATWEGVPQMAGNSTDSILFTAHASHSSNKLHKTVKISSLILTNEHSFFVFRNWHKMVFSLLYILISSPALRYQHCHTTHVSSSSISPLSLSSSSSSSSSFKFVWKLSVKSNAQAHTLDWTRCAFVLDGVKNVTNGQGVSRSRMCEGAGCMWGWR